MTTQMPHPAPAAGPAGPDTRVVGRRVVGLLVDVAAVSTVGYLVAGLAEIVFHSDAYNGMTPTGRILTIVVGIALWVAAFVVVPVATGGRTLGMALVGVRVVRAGGGEPSAGQHLVRGLCFVVDGLVSGLVGLIVILRSQRQRRVGDMAAGTLVVRDRA